MKKVRQAIVPAYFMLSIFILKYFYTVLNTGSRGYTNLVTDLDRMTPFIKESILPYISWYIFLYATLIYFCIHDRYLYYRVVAAIDIGLILCYVIFYFYQTTVPRPELVGNDFFTRLVAKVYGNDLPFNCFPSIHCLTSYILMLAVNKCSFRNRVNWIVINTIGMMIIISTLTVKQHVILDALSAMLIGDVLFKLMGLIDWEKLMTRRVRKLAVAVDNINIDEGNDRRINMNKMMR